MASGPNAFPGGPRSRYLLGGSPSERNGPNRGWGFKPSGSHENIFWKKMQTWNKTKNKIKNNLLVMFFYYFESFFLREKAHIMSTRAFYFIRTL